MPAALVGVASCGRCGAATLPKQSHCLDCGMTLLDASPASVLGGYPGVRLARRLDVRILRGLIVGYGLVVATVMLVR